VLPTQWQRSGDNNTSRIKAVFLRPKEHQMTTPYETVNNMARAICGMKPNPFRGMQEYEYVARAGFAVRCYLEYTKAYDGGRDEPSESENIELCHAFVGVIDIAEVLDKELATEIEGLALKAMKQGAFDDAYDAAEARAQDRCEVSA
jgi:hypothetical protein